MRCDSRLLKASFSILTSSAMPSPLLEGGKEGGEVKEARWCCEKSLLIQSALIDYQCSLARFHARKKRGRAGTIGVVF